jgi:glycosyltransferase involved in cell wall biosynthesis
MRVLLLSRYDRLGASSRLRLYQYLPYLESHGFEVTVAPLLSDDYVRGLYSGNIPWVSVLHAYITRLGYLLWGKKYDLVWVEKEMLPWVPGWIELGLFPTRVPLVLDYDDAIFHRYDLHGVSLVRRLLGRKIDAVMRRADLVVAGNDYIGERAKRAGARRVELMPTVVDTDRYTTATASLSTPVTVGWIGSPSTAHYLDLVAPVLRKMIASRGVRVMAIGANRAQLTQLPIDFQPWSEDTEAEEIRKFDIGIMPLPDSPWERGKCGYKLIQYMACGKPVVASPVGANNVIVQHGLNGFLANDERGWIDALDTLCGSSVLRQAMGQKGRELVDSKYSLQVTAPRMELLLRSVVNG